MTTETQPENATSTTDSNITIQDLVVMLSVLQVAAARGAIKAEEMAITGALHDKLKKFLESVGAAQQPAATPPVTPVTESVSIN